MKLAKALFVLALAAFVSAPAFAETQNVKVSGSIDTYAFARDNFDFTNNDAGSVPAGAAAVTPAATLAQRSEGDAYLMSITQLAVSADLTDNVSTVVNLINQRDWNSAIYDATAITGNAGAAFDLLLDLAYVQLKEIFYAPLTLTIGRQDLVFGRGFIIGWNPQDPSNSIEAEEFTQIQSFDAIRATLDFNPWTVDFVYSKINENSNNAEDDNDLYITNVNYKFAEYNAVAEAYYMNQADRATLATAAATGSRDNVTQTLGGRVQFDPISQITLGAELAFQFGEHRLAVGDPEREREAMAVDIFGEYRFDNTWKPMVGLEYVYLSGEGDLSASSGSYGAWNGAFRGPIYGWIHDYKETYYGTAATYDQIAGQNQQHISLYGSILPLEDLKLSANYFHFWATEDMHIVPAVPTSATMNNHIGDEIDTAIVYSYTEDVTFTFMANWFIPGELYDTSLGGKDVGETASEFVSEVKVVF